MMFCHWKLQLYLLLYLGKLLPFKKLMNVNGQTLLRGCTASPTSPWHRVETWQSWTQQMNQHRWALGTFFTATLLKKYPRHFIRNIFEKNTDSILIEWFIHDSNSFIQESIIVQRIKLPKTLFPISANFLFWKVPNLKSLCGYVLTCKKYLIE